MLNIKFFITILLFFLALQDCTILIVKQQFFVFSILLFVFLILYIIKNYNIVIKKFIMACKDTPIKFICFFILFMFFSSFFQGDLYTILKINFRIIFIYILTIAPIIIFSICIFPRSMSYSKLMKYFIFSYQFIIYYGIIDFLCKSYLNTKAPLYNIVCSKSLWFSILGEQHQIANHVLTRACSVFFEPSFFAMYIFLFLPVCYWLFKTKVKIINNPILNKLFIIQLLVSSLLALLLTKSPIYIIACLLYSIIFFYNDLFNIIKKNILITSSIIIFFCIYIPVIEYTPSANIDNEIFVRVQKTIFSIKNFDDFVYAEPSLATRIVRIFNTIQAASKKPFIGVGDGNTFEAEEQQYKVTTIPITKEIYETTIKNNKYIPAANIFCSTLLSNGIIGIFLLYSFFITSIYYAIKNKKKFLRYDRLLLEILISIAINYIITSFYWGLITYPMMWFIFGLLNSYILTAKNPVVNGYKMALPIQKKEDITV